MKQTKYFGLGLLIFIALVASLFSAALIMNANALSILNGDSRENISNIYYELDLSELGLTDQYYTVYDEAANMTTIINMTFGLDYACMLDISGDNTDYVYLYNDSTFDTDSLVLVNTTLLDPLSDGYYEASLGCDYYINATNQTTLLNNSDNSTVVDISMMFTASHDTMQKSILVDTASPIISLSSPGTPSMYSVVFSNLSNVTNITAVTFSNVPLNITLTDLSSMDCVLDLDSTAYSILSGTSYDISPLSLMSNHDVALSNGTNASDVYALNASVLSVHDLDMLMNITIGNYSMAPLIASLLNYSMNSSINYSSILYIGNNPYNLSASPNTSINQTQYQLLYTQSYNIPYSVSCVDDIDNTASGSSYIPVSLNIYASMYANNASASQNNTGQNNTLNNTNNTNLTDSPYFNIDVSKQVFSLGELGQYLINATNSSNVSITICPIASGWVQCFMAPTFVNDTYPKIQSLPYTNKTGKYVIEGVMRYKNYTIVRNITYETTNTLTADIIASKSVGVIGDILTFNATASMGISPYTYKWTMHDNTKFTGVGAYKNYTAAGTYRVNLTVNDSAGNNYSTYFDVTIKNKYVLTVIVLDDSSNKRISDADVSISKNSLQSDSSGVAKFTLKEGSYDLVVLKENYARYTLDVDLDDNITVYANLSFTDSTDPIITLRTNNDMVFAPDAVDLKFTAEDISKMTCSLYTAGINDSWYTLKDSGDNLLSNTEYTFEIRDLGNGAYKWKIECIDADGNKAYSTERTFIVSDGEVTVALESNADDSDDINLALDNLGKLSGDESAVVEALGIKSELQNLLEKINRLDKNIHDLAYRRDLDENGVKEAQKNLTDEIEYLKYNTPVDLKVTDSKTFVKYVLDEDLKATLDEYASLKSMNLDRKLFLESTKLAQSRVIVSTHVRNVELYYLDGHVSEMTLVTRDIQAAKPEDSAIIENSNSITFLEVIPKSIVQSANQVTFLTKEYTVLKDDPMVEFPPSTSAIVYYINKTVSPDLFQDADTILVEKNINAIASTTGFSIFGIDSVSDISLDGRSIMIIVIVLLIMFYLVMNFDLIDKIRHINFGFKGIGSKKKISFIRVLVNDAVDYLSTEDYDKASLIYREIRLSYEEANDYVKRQVYDESIDLCNQLDMNYALKILDEVERHIRNNDRNAALMEFEKLENTFNKLSEPYQSKIVIQFKRIADMIKMNKN